MGFASPYVFSFPREEQSDALGGGYALNYHMERSHQAMGMTALEGLQEQEINYIVCVTRHLGVQLLHMFSLS